MKKTILFNPVSIVHARNMSIFKKAMPDCKLRCIYNPNLPWFADMEKGNNDESIYFTRGYFPRLPKYAFRDVAALVLFTSQPRVPACNLIQEATLQGIPVIAVEEVYQMMLHQNSLNNYFLPLDHLFVASSYEKEKFAELGVSPEIIEITGYIFGNSEYKLINSHEDLKSSFNLSNHKSTLTICLDALSSEVDALGVCKRLLISLAKNLPRKYELLIKPHPVDKKSDFLDLVKQYFPDGKIAHPRMNIDRVLDVTDILLNRGNSQVIIDALQRQIPVIAMPLGKKTFFHGLLDEVIVNENNLESVLNLVEAKGMDLYKEIFWRYLSISPEEALKKIISRIIRIAENKEINKPQERLMELALFWAWIGYVSKASEILRKYPRNINNNTLLEKVHRLVSCRAQKEDLFFLKKHYGNTYREWIIQSLWIKTLYLRHNRIDSQDEEWLANYPPAMNKRSFLPYVFLLNKLKALNSGKKRGPIFNISYLISRTKYKSLLTLRDLYASQSIV